MFLLKSLILYRVLAFIVQDSVAVELLTHQDYELEASNRSGSSSCYLQLYPRRQLICTSITKDEDDLRKAEAFRTLSIRMRSKRWVLNSRQNPRKRPASGSQSPSRSAGSRPSSRSGAPQRAPRSRPSSESMASRRMPKSSRSSGSGRVPMHGSSSRSSGSGRAPMPGSSFRSSGSGRAPMPGSSSRSSGTGRAPMPGSSSRSSGSGRAPMPGSSSGKRSAPRASNFSPSSGLMPESRIPKAHPLPNSKTKQMQKRGSKPKESSSHVLQRTPNAYNRLQRQMPRTPGPRRWNPTKPPPTRPLDRPGNQRKQYPGPNPRPWTPRSSRQPRAPKPSPRPRMQKYTRPPWAQKTSPRPRIQKYTRQPWAQKTSPRPRIQKYTRQPWAPKPSPQPRTQKSTNRPRKKTTKTTSRPKTKTTNRPRTKTTSRPRTKTTKTASRPRTKTSKTTSQHKTKTTKTTNRPRTKTTKTASRPRTKTTKTASRPRTKTIKTTPRPRTTKTTRLPRTTTRRRQLTTRSRMATSTLRNGIPTEQSRIAMKHNRVQHGPKEHESSEGETSDQEPVQQEPNEGIPEAQGSNTFDISFNPVVNINFPQAQGPPLPDDQVQDEGSETSRVEPRHQETGVETESRDRYIPRYSKENDGSEQSNSENEKPWDISRHPKESSHVELPDTVPENPEDGDSHKSGDFKFPGTLESHTENTGLRQEIPKEDSDLKLPVDLANCICQTESQCNATIGCKDELCGPFQINESYWRDAGSIGGDWRNCTTGSDSLDCSIRTVQSYIIKYARTCALLLNEEPGYEHYVRVHHGGPFGCLSSDTIEYWRKVDRCLNAVDLQ